MDIVQSLIRDHEEMRTLLNAIHEQSESSTLEKRLLMSSFEKLLDRHTYEEEHFLYVQLSSSPALRPETLEGYEEHRLVGILMKELKQLPYAHEKWLAKFKVMHELMVNHLQEEEEDLFPGVKKVLSAQQMFHLGEKAQESRLENLKVAY